MLTPYIRLKDGQAQRCAQKVMLYSFPTPQTELSWRFEDSDADPESAVKVLLSPALMPSVQLFNTSQLQEASGW